MAKLYEVIFLRNPTSARIFTASQSFQISFAYCLIVRSDEK